MTMQLDEVALQRDLLEKIERTDHGKYSVKVKTLMVLFGFSAEHRVRQASLDGVVDRLEEWGITCSFSDDARSANDRVSMSRSSFNGKGAPAGAHPQPVARAGAPEPIEATFNPLHFGFLFEDGTSDLQSEALAEQIIGHVWAFRPVCLVVEGDDADLALAGAVLGAVMRRRSLFLGPDAAQDPRPTSPEILAVSSLAMLVGRPSASGTHASTGALGGSVVLVRVDQDDARADDVLALVRDVLVPHTYRARTRPPGSLQTFTDWAAAFASSPGLAPDLLARFQRTRGTDASSARAPDLAAVITAASQIRDALFEVTSERGLDPMFRAGFESTEHMALKASVQRYLIKLYGAAAVHIEETYDAEEGDSSDAPSPPRPPGAARLCRPDLRVEGKIWVEIETLRGRGMRMRDPFFQLERSMLKRLKSAKAGEEIWLLVPSDLAMLASRKLEILARNLRAARQEVTVCWGFVDLDTDQPVILRGAAEKDPVRVELTGRSWRERRTATTTPTGWGDVAGYSDLKRRLGDDVLDAIKAPEKYRAHGLTSANGLLLYGLPGCGKSLMGRVLASEAGVACKVLLPSDLTSMWLGEGVSKIREAFDWAIDQEDGCLLVLDELDAVAPVRSEHNMHSDEKRQVNELLVQLDRIAKKPVIVVGTTNYVRGIDGAVRRSGRFDVKLPVYPPDRDDRKAIFEHYVKHLKMFDTSDVMDSLGALADRTPLFAPADIEAVVNLAARRAVVATRDGGTPRLTILALRGIADEHQRSIRREAAIDWVREAREELGAREAPKLDALERDIAAAYPV